MNEKFKQIVSLQDAYNQKYFSKRITRHQLLDNLVKKYPNMKITSTATHRGLVDGNKFICGIGYPLSISYFTLQEKQSGKILMRGYPKILKILRSKGYEIFEKDLF